MKLIIIFALWTGILLFLSFQSGSQTRAISYRMAEVVIKVFNLDNNITNIAAIMRISRMIARIVLFFFFGVMSMAVVTVMLAGKVKLFFQCLINIAVCCVVAFETEWIKTFIAGRHCTYSEMFISFIASVAGIAAFYTGLVIRGRIRRKSVSSQNVLTQ